MVKWSDTSENVLRQQQIVQIQHTYVISSQKIKKKTELFGPTLLRNFPLKKSDFLGIFKNVLTGVYCTCITLDISLFLYCTIFSTYLRL
jgi:hypothetical protein